MKEFTLTNKAVETVKQQYHRIKTLFADVTISIDGSTKGITSTSNWVYITGPSEERCEKAKKYITALTTPSQRVIMTVPLDFQNLLLQNNRQMLISIEKENAAVIDLDVESRQLSILGDEFDVVLASSLIDDKINSFKQSKTTEKEIDALTNSLKNIIIDPNVKSFALKLGYDDTDVLTAAKSCVNNNLDVNEDTILKELMKLKPLDNDKQEEDNVFSNFAQTVAESTNKQATNSDLRGIVIDGSNVALCHGHKLVYSCVGIELVIDWFRKRGHTNIVAFVPKWRQEASKPDSPIKNQEILQKLENQKNLVYTPSRRINGKRVVCYDDRFILKYAVATDSIIVSNDNFRDLHKENPKWKQYLDEHLLMYSFVNDMFMPPDDPLGRSGPTLDEFLQKGSTLKQQCPYRNKCTYGTKCRYYHPESSTISGQSTVYSTDSDNLYKNYSMCGNDSKQYCIGSQSTVNRYPMNMSCAAEIKMYEQQRQPFQYLSEHDILAKGCEKSETLKGTPSADINIRDWNSQHHQAVYPMSYYQSQYPLPQQKRQQIQHPQRYYQLQGSNHMNSAYSPYSPGNQYAQPSSQQSPQQQHQQYILTPMLSTQPPPHTSSLLPGNCMVNHQYYKPATISHSLHPMDASQQSTLYIQDRCHSLSMSANTPNANNKNSQLIYLKLSELFPDRPNVIQRVLIENPNERNLDILAQKIMSL